MISALSGWALVLAGVGYAVKFWLSSRHLFAWPTACTGMRSLWFLMVLGCVGRGVQLIRGAETIQPYGIALTFVICAVSAAEAAAVIRGGRLPPIHITGTTPAAAAARRA